MSVRGLVIALISVALAGASIAPAAIAQGGPRQTAKLRFTQQKPGKPSGLALRIDYVNPSDPAAKPPAVRRVIQTLSRGGRFDTGAPGHCTASDLELTLLGTAACPETSRVGAGAITFDTGLPHPLRSLVSPVDFLNNVNQLIFLNRVLATESPRVVTRARVTRRRAISEAPFLPGTLPDGAAVDTVRARYPRTVRRIDGERRSYVTTPPRCPRRRFWINRIRFTYDDGVRQAVATRSRCTP